MVLWRSGKNATLFAHMMCPGAQCSILDVVTIFDYIYNGDSHGIPAEFQQNSNGIPWIRMGIIPGGSRILTISIGIPQKKVGISMELESKMAEAPANSFPLKFHGIPQNSDFPLGICRNSWRRVKTSRNVSHGNPGNSIGIPLKFRQNPMGITIIYIVKNSYNIKN